MAFLLLFLYSMLTFSFFCKESNVHGSYQQGLYELVERSFSLREDLIYRIVLIESDPGNPLSLSTISTNLCFKNKRYPRIPTSHIASKKIEPLIIVHRGNFIEYQENSLEAFTSLIGKGIDGFELDVFLTKDKELVVFHDENTLRMTGKNATIWDLTVSEIAELDLKTTVKYTDEYIYSYSRPVKIPLLKDVLRTFRKSDILLYIELKPSYNPVRNEEDFQRALETGKAVAKLVADMEMEDKVYVVSFEPIKVWAAKRENPNLVTGIYFWEGYWKLRSFEYAKLKEYYKIALPGLWKCLDSLPNNSSMMDFLFSSGTLLYSIQASTVGLSANLFIDTKINRGKNIFQILANSLVPTVKIGVGIVYWVQTPKPQHQALDKLWQGLIVQGVQLLMTDDGLRLKKRIGRGQSDNPLSLSTIPNDLCFKEKRYPQVPSSHIASKKAAPFIVAHRGDILKYQENSLQAITSVIGKGIDGVEFDVFLTKDKELVVFHDENTYRMTGVNATIWKLTAAEIYELNLKTTVKYSDENILYYPWPLKIPLLRDVLTALKRSNLLIFIVLRPLDNPLRGPTDLQLALDTGTSVADMVTEMEMEDQVVLMSTEPIKLVVAKRQNHHLQTNVIFFTRYWQLSSSQYAEIKKYYKIYLPGLSECLDNLPNDKSMMDFLFSSGTLLYSTEATSTGVFIDMFLDSKVNQGKDLFKILGNSLVPTISIGSGVVDWLETPNALKAAQDKLWPKLIKQGIQSLLTDDWLRLKGIIGRVDGGYTDWTPYGPCGRTCGYGIKIRTRACTNPKPANGGRTCDRLGPCVEMRYCKVTSCAASYYDFPQ